jgi:hypothetical protein
MRIHQIRTLQKNLPAILAVLLLAVVLSGCRSPAPDPVRQYAVEELNLLAMPVALNLDNLPGPDGFAVKVYAGSRAEPKPIRITHGTLEVVIYDGVVPVTALLATPPLRVWRFGPDQLPLYETKTSIGVGYDFTLSWEENRPARNQITVTSRYTSPEGRVLYAAPTPITVISP